MVIDIFLDIDAILLTHRLQATRIALTYRAKFPLIIMAIYFTENHRRLDRIVFCQIKKKKYCADLVFPIVG